MKNDFFRALIASCSGITYALFFIWVCPNYGWLIATMGGPVVVVGTWCVLEPKTKGKSKG